MFTLATSEPCQTGLVPFSKTDISRTTGTQQVPVSLLVSAFDNGTKPVWHGSEVASVDALLHLPSLLSRCLSLHYRECYLRRAIKVQQEVITNDISPQSGLVRS